MLWLSKAEVSTPSDSEVAVTRDFAAPRALVYRAFTRPELVSRWLLGPPFRPARHAAKLHCPWLVCVGEADRVARPAPAIAAARPRPP